MSYFKNSKFQFVSLFGKIILPLFIMSISGLLVQSSLACDYKEGIEKFELPEKLTEWQNVTTDFMSPVLTTPQLRDQWKTLTDLTMPSHGNFDPIDPARRLMQIKKTLLEMLEKNETERLAFLVSLYDRHKVILGK